MSNRAGVFVLAFAALGMFVGWSVWQWHLAQTELVFAGKQLTECRRLASRISRLRQAPAQFEDSLKSNDALARLVESTVKKAAIDQQRITEISPGEPRRVGDTPYKEQMTRVGLREVTLPQLIRVLLTVPQSDPAIQIGSLNLRVPAGTNSDSGNSNQDEFWNAELTLTSQFYAPIVEASR